MKLLIAIIVLMSLIALYPQISPADPTLSMDMNVDTGVRAALNEQAAAWNRGDWNGFIDGYLTSPDTSYFSGDTEVYGIEAIRDRYQKRYGKDASTMGTLTFSDLKVHPLSKNSALCTGHFHLVRQQQPDANGIFSLVFVRAGGAWKVMHDHTSASTNSDKQSLVPSAQFSTR